MCSVLRGLRLGRPACAFDMLMGPSVPPRRRFIQTHAKEVRDLDV